MHGRTQPERGAAGTPRTDADQQRALDVLAMHQLASRTDGGLALLRWVARRTGCWAALLGRSGTVLVETSATHDAGSEPDLARAVATMRERGHATYAAEDPSGRRVLLLRTGEQRRATNRADLVFAMIGDTGSVPVSLPADAALMLTTCWTAEKARQNQNLVETAEARCRESVLHLLMSGNPITARQVASTLSPALPDPMRMHIIECPANTRQEVLDRCADLTGGTAWAVRCPVRARHVIVLTPTSRARTLDEQDNPPFAGLLDEFAGTDKGTARVVGTSDAVALHDAATAYHQAFHALAVARTLPRRWARFDAALDLPTVLGQPGLTWANVLLRPLLSHVPRRAGDPGAHELIATARSWLTFSTGATRHLKIHRNTLASRLRLLEELLGLDLARTGNQAALNLALRVRETPCPPGPAQRARRRRHIELADLLRLPATQRWAQATLRPVSGSDRPDGLQSTLRVWLHNDARLSATAEALDLSVPGVRKRIIRLEQLLRRSLLHAPSAHHDLWLALHALDLGRRTGPTGGAVTP